MTGVVLRRDLRRRPLALVGLALVIVLGGGSALAALVLAHRTDRAYPDYVHDADVADLVVNPSLSTAAIGRAIRHLPGVEEVHSSALLLAAVDPRLRAGRSVVVGEMSDTDNWLQVLGSTDGRFTRADRPVVSEGRLPTGTGEVFVNETYRARLSARLHRRLEVGDRLTTGFFPAKYSETIIDPSLVVTPIGVEQLRISGFGYLPDEVLPDGLYPRERLVVSGDVARRYSCLTDFGNEQTRDEAFATIMPDDCARQYDYYALRLRDGSRGVRAVRAGFARAASQLSAEIPEAFRDEASYYYVAQNRTDSDRAVQRTIRPTVVTLLAFAGVAALATVVVFALALIRMLARDEPIRRSLLALGATRGMRTRLTVVAPLVALGVGVVGAVAVAVLASAFGPLGSVADVVPDPGIVPPVGVLVPATLALGAVLVLVVLGLGWSAAGRAASRHPRRAPAGPLRAATALARTGRPAFTEGVRTALSTRAGGSTVAVAGCAIALLVVTGAALFDTNLLALADRPERYGWPWDVAVITGGGYGDTEVTAVRTGLEGRADVRDYGFYALDASTRIEGRPVPAVVGLRGSPAPALPVVEGRMATRPGEAVLGTTTAEELGLAVGDRARFSSELIGDALGMRRVEVVGLAVLPSLGPFLSERTGLGLGAYVRSGAEPVDDIVALTAIRLEPGVDARRVPH